MYNNVMRHKDYTAAIYYSEEDGFFVGRILGIYDTVNFHGHSIEELREQFAVALDSYLSDCEVMGKTTGNPNQIYFVLPIYIAEVDADALNNAFFDGYSIVDIKHFYENYIDKLSDFNGLLHSDIPLPMPGMAITRPEARYVLLKKLGSNNDESVFRSEAYKAHLMITALRLYAQGSLHVHRLYFLSRTMHRNQRIETSTSLYDIENYCFNGNSEHASFKQYQISAETLKKLPSLIESIAKIYDRFWLPLSYFNQYHSSKTLIDKLIKLSIVWESTLLNGIQSELSYRFCIRGTHLLKKDSNSILKTAYDVRSSIVHTGDIDSKAIEKMRKFFNKDDSDFLVFFRFMNEYLEPLTREILNEFLKKMLGDNKNVTQVADAIDNEVFLKLSNTQAIG
jgi:predicted HicB family RNase H-like nuclease